MNACGHIWNLFEGSTFYIATYLFVPYNHECALQRNVYKIGAFVHLYALVVHQFFCNIYPHTHEMRCVCVCFFLFWFYIHIIMHPSTRILFFCFLSLVCEIIVGYFNFENERSGGGERTFSLSLSLFRCLEKQCKKNTHKNVRQRKKRVEKRSNWQWKRVLKK